MTTTEYIAHDGKHTVSHGIEINIARAGENNLAHDIEKLILHMV